jgi:histidyl-tRNA synthetase
LPGIGISIGLTRIFAKLMREGRIQAGRKAPTDILVVHTQGAPYSVIRETAGSLRARGLKVEQYHEDRKLKAQLKYAADKDIPWIWFPPAEAGGEHQVKNSATRDQTPADPATWLPE